jgi:DNA-binding transcriptional ArsR family regulator
MPDYQLEIKQIVNYPRCRVYREFVQALSILALLQDRHLITFTILGHGKLVKYRVTGWRRHNTVLDYNCPCQKDTGFFFMPTAIAAELIGAGRASEMDVVLDLWLSAIYKDEQVLGSDVGPVVYFRNGTGNPLVSYTDLARRWGVSRSTVGRLLKKLADSGYLDLMSFPGRSGSVIYLKNYLSTMFQISDVLVDKDEVAMSLNIRLSMDAPSLAVGSVEDTPPVSNEVPSVSKAHTALIIEKVRKVLATQGVSCLSCPRSTYKLSLLSDDCKGVSLEASSQIAQMELTVLCVGERPVYTFALTLTPTRSPALKGAPYHGKEEH